MSVARHVGTACLAGSVAGVLVGGLLGRVVMRISGFMAGAALAGVHTENGNVVGDITLAGTLALILFVGLPSGILGGLLYALLEPWLSRLRPWHGLFYGIALLATAGFAFLDPVNFDFRRFGVTALNVAMFAALFVLFGVATAWLFDRLRALRAGTTGLARTVDILAWVALIAAGLLVLLFLGGGAGLEPIVAIVIVAVLLVPAIVRWRGLPPSIGYASLIVVLLLGAVRTVTGVLQLLTGT